MDFDPIDTAIGDLVTGRAPTEPLYATSAPDASPCTELLPGEPMRVLDPHAPFECIEVECLHDGYRGFLPGCIVQRASEATHRVVARGTLGFHANDIKSHASSALPFGSQVRAYDDTPYDGGELIRTNGGWMPAAHLRPIDRPCTDAPIELARRHFLGAPYRWGGRSPLGCDCSGLVQVVHGVCGIALPRDSGPQERATTIIDAADARSGDLVFWPGHVAFIDDDDRVLHATAHGLSVTIEPLSAVIARAGEPSGWRRVELG